MNKTSIIESICNIQNELHLLVEKFNMLRFLHRSPEEIRLTEIAIKNKMRFITIYKILKSTKKAAKKLKLKNAELCGVYSALNQMINKQSKMTKMTKLTTGLNFDFIKKTYNEANIEMECIFLEGCSRSGKTTDTLTFIADYCSSHADKRVLVVRGEYIDVKYTTRADFQNIIERGYIDYSLVFSNSLKYIEYEFSLHNKVTFCGIDNVDLIYGGDKFDVVFFNNLTDCENEDSFLYLKDYCKSLFIADYNPPFDGNSWINKQVLSDPTIKVFKSSFVTNVFLGEHEKRKILSYDPSNPINIKNGTADDYFWQIYGLGRRFESFEDYVKQASK